MKLEFGRLSPEQQAAFVEFHDACLVEDISKKRLFLARDSPAPGHVAGGRVVLYNNGGIADASKVLSLNMVRSAFRDGVCFPLTVSPCYFALAISFGPGWWRRQERRPLRSVCGLRCV